MALLRYDPWSSMSDLQKEMNHLFKHHLSMDDDNSKVETSQWTPDVDIKEEDKRFFIHADIPGVEPEGIEISVDKGILTIKGERFNETTESKQGYTRTERVAGTFYRRFSLPDTADLDHISASNKHGVLTVDIPKREVAASRRIEVKSS